MPRALERVEWISCADTCSSWLEVAGEVGEGGEFEQDLASGGLVDDLMLQHPGEVVGDKDGVQASCEGGVDVGAGAVADHPGAGSFAGVVRGEREVGLGMFFGQDLDGGEVGFEAGAVELVSLLFRIALGDEQDAVAGGEIGEGLGDAGKQLDLLIGDGLGEAEDAGMLLFGEGMVGELLEAGDEGLTEAVESVAMRGDGGVLALVEVAADLFGCVDAVVEIGDEGGDDALKVDVVLPEGVVGVDEEGLVDRAAGDFDLGFHSISIGGFVKWRQPGGMVGWMVDLRKSC